MSWAVCLSGTNTSFCVGTSVAVNARIKLMNGDHAMSATDILSTVISSMVRLGWVGLGWVGLGWVGLGWVGLAQVLIMSVTP
jgi:hypothetical protein